MGADPPAQTEGTGAGQNLAELHVLPLYRTRAMNAITPLELERMGTRMCEDGFSDQTILHVYSLHALVFPSPKGGKQIIRAGKPFLHAVKACGFSDGQSDPLYTSCFIPCRTLTPRRLSSVGCR